MSRLIRSFALLFSPCSLLFAQNVLVPGTPVLDRPTLVTLGIQLPVSGDANFNSSVSVQYRVSGTQTWKQALPMFRVHPETVAYYTVAPQFGATIFDLRPATTYDIQLHAVDPDGLDQTFLLQGTTRAVPSGPANPRNVAVNNVPSLNAALANVQPGDVITLANGTYSGSFFGVYHGGTAANPIVIRGQSENGVVLDGGGCVGCNIFEVYGAGYVYLENMTMQNATRAIRFQTAGSVGNVVRYVHIKNTELGIGGQSNHLDFYIADNILEGRLVWPQVYSNDGGIHASDDGIAVFGFGHVVAHNRISGYGDAMKTAQDGARSIDFYGNDIVYTYDNGVELDGGEGNVRCFRNRFMNCSNPLSVQPIHGGPAYLVRNVVVNLFEEQMKFHPELAPNGPQEPSGVLAYNNTFVAPAIPELNLQTSGASHYFAVENNIFVSAAGNRQAVDWTGSIDHGLFDYNAYFPDGVFRFNNPAFGGYFYQPNFAGLKALGMEPHGMLASGQLFASGLQPPVSYLNQLPPADAALAPWAPVIDRALLLPNINDNYVGSGPDLGALEYGCPEPIYGPRPVGTDETNQVTGCGPAVSAPLTITVSPAAVSLSSRQQQQFTATGGAVKWSIQPSIGTISSSGLYSAPQTRLPGQSGNLFIGDKIVVTATPVSSGAMAASATVTIVAQ